MFTLPNYRKTSWRDHAVQICVLHSIQYIVISVVCTINICKWLGKTALRRFCMSIKGTILVEMKTGAVTFFHGAFLQLLKVLQNYLRIPFPAQHTTCPHITLFFKMKTSQFILKTQPHFHGHYIISEIYQMVYLDLLV